MTIEFKPPSEQQKQIMSDFATKMWSAFEVVQKVNHPHLVHVYLKLKEIIHLFNDIVVECEDDKADELKEGELVEKPKEEASH